jgi:hypothetical protein
MYLRGLSPRRCCSPQPDDIIPFDHGRVFAASNPPKQFLELVEGYNDGFIIFMRESWVKVLGDLLSEQMDGACTT